MTRYTLIIRRDIEGTSVYPNLTRREVEDKLQGDGGHVADGQLVQVDHEPCEDGQYLIIAGEVCKPGRWGRVVSEYHGYLKRLQASFRIGSYRHIQSAIDRMTSEEAHDWFRWLQQVERKMQSESRTFRQFPGGPKIRM